ncbi:MAG TPA: nucleotide exchange factor GrpE [Candidatus Azoamicus sp. OHIO2]
MYDEKEKTNKALINDIMLQEEPREDAVRVKKEFELLEIKCAENFDLFLRAKAELENVQKRTVKEIDNIIKYANKKILLDLLPVLDGLESCFSINMNDLNVDGLKIFYNMLIEVLNTYNVKKICAERYLDFDPLKHEVTATIDNSDYDNKIESVVQNGYMLYDQVLRYSKVIIFKKNNGVKQEV